MFLKEKIGTCVSTIHTIYFLDYAFLRSNPHVEAMCTCIQALGNGDFQLLAKIDNILVSTIYTALI